jgi:hypothetical protein
MRELIDAFWRAAVYCLYPRVIVLSLLPLVIATGVAVGLSWLYWDAAVAWVRAALDGWGFVAFVFDWFASIGIEGVRDALAPVLIVAVAVPAIVVVSLLLVAVLMTPALVNLVAKRRFPALERRRGATLLHSIAWSLGCTILAVVLLVASMPLWLVPPFVLVLPPLIWGWLTYKVMAFDSLAEHASAEERRALLREHRMPLLGMGIVAGYMGAAPSLLWAAGAVLLVLAPVVIVVAVWLYTVVFAFSALWFTHYTLAALERLRARAAAAAAPPLPDATTTRPEAPPLPLPGRVPGEGL